MTPLGFLPFSRSFRLSLILWPSWTISRNPYLDFFYFLDFMPFFSNVPLGVKRLWPSQFDFSSPSCSTSSRTRIQKSNSRGRKLLVHFFGVCKKAKLTDVKKCAIFSTSLEMCLIFCDGVLFHFPMMRAVGVVAEKNINQQSAIYLC